MTSPLRLGLCCQFLDAPIHFRTATHRYVSGLTRAARRTYLADIARDNAAALAAAVDQCAALGIGAFRINSQILPLGTHPVSGYALDALDRKGEIRDAFQRAGELARTRSVRLSFHPDQFVVLNSERADVVRASAEELEFQTGVAELVGADIIVFHGGSTAGGVPAALERLERGLDLLSERARRRIALENDDHRFTPADLLPLCRSAGVPLVYDAHHHRCHPDGMSVVQATELAERDVGRARAVDPHLVAARRVGGGEPAAARGLHRHRGFSDKLAGASDDGGCRGEGEGAGGGAVAGGDQSGGAGASTVTEPDIPTPPGPPCTAQW